MLLMHLKNGAKLLSSTFLLTLLDAAAASIETVIVALTSIYAVP